MIIKIVVAFIIAVAILAGMITLQSETYTVSRSIVVAAPASVVFAQINDFHNWAKWSPWEKLDPSMTRSYEGATAGTGAVYRWSGNSKAGEGIMRITESRPGDRIAVQLAFSRPYASSSDVTFTLHPDGKNSGVTWSMVGKNNFALKAVSFFSSMDRLLGPDFERGLADLKIVAEDAQK